MTPSDRLGRGLEGVVLFGLCAVPLTVGWTVAGVHIAIGLATAAALTLGFVRRRWLVARTPADLAMIAFALASLLAAWTSEDRLQCVATLKKLLLLPLVHLTAGAFATPRRARLALRLFVAAMAATALVAMLHFLLLPHASDARLRSTGHYMTFAGLLLLAWPPAAAAAVACRGRARLIYALLLPVFGLALLLGFTRGAWIGSVVAGLVLLARARPRWAWVVPVVAALALVVMPPAYRSRALSTFDPHHPTNVDRLRLWHTGWNILRHHPWTGVGPVDLRPYVLRYRSTTEGQVHGHLHDNWIHIAATLGSIGLLAFLWLMIGLGRMAWGAGRARAPAELHGLALGIWGSYCGFQWMGLFEWNFGDVEVTIALYFLLGAGWAVVRAAGQDRDIDAGPTGRGMSS